mmetsp:Transcript_114653/g.199400  ORF Transcript_114653/g.199400 Transcript_114653/m.199400 type:complete len:133 (-) Transcript_114653:1408-1806(-)
MHTSSHQQGRLPIASTSTSMYAELPCGSTRALHLHLPLPPSVDSCSSADLQATPLLLKSVGPPSQPQILTGLPLGDPILCTLTCEVPSPQSSLTFPLEWVVTVGTPCHFRCRAMAMHQRQLSLGQAYRLPTT